MKLPSFLNDTDFLRILSNVGASFIEWKPPRIFLSPEVAKKLEEGTLEVDRAQGVETDYSGLLTFAGRKVSVYIRDQHITRSRARYFAINHTSEYKFHLTRCFTIQNMEKNGRYNSRYVYTNRKDGVFLVNQMRYGQVISKNIKIRLELCQNCWDNLRINGTTERLGVSSKDSFDISAYFKRFNIHIRDLPTHNPVSAPLNTYQDEQERLAKRLKKKYHYVCQQCKNTYDTHSSWLHLHHIDGQKSNNLPSNLTIYCLACHAEEPFHQHMKSHKDYEKAKEFRESASKRRGVL